MIGVVFSDLRRGFELVDRNILIRKLKWYGIKGVVNSRFKKYLENRTQRVKFSGVLSDSITVKEFHRERFWGRCCLSFILMI